MADLTEHLRDLVAANRILAHEGVIDAFGHVSIRHPERPDRYIMSCSRSPELVEFDDLGVYEMDGTPVDAGPDRRHYGERFIHGAILEARPEINAVVHNHSHAVIPFGVTGVKIRPLVHTAAGVGEEVPIWDIREDFGDCTTMLVVNMEQGRSLAGKLGRNNVALMRGHGCAVVGTTIMEAVATSIYLQVNARLQIEANDLAGMDSITFVAPGEIEQMQKYQPIGLPRAWEYWKRRVGC
jgi:ribulose-5-phosphate 4-epimerase/fuculose-1-phosphate aldolase